VETPEYGGGVAGIPPERGPRREAPLEPLGVDRAGPCPLRQPVQLQPECLPARLLGLERHENGLERLAAGNGLGQPPLARLDRQQLALDRRPAAAGLVRAPGNRLAGGGGGRGRRWSVRPVTSRFAPMEKTRVDAGGRPPFGL
jgi:hypothetical protein